MNAHLPLEPMATAEPVTLWPQQAEAVEKLIRAHDKRANPVASMPTGSGKARTAAALAKTLSRRGDERIIITVPSRELAEQNEAALLLFLPRHEVGVVCAALERREFNRRVIVGTPQSLAGQIRFDPTCVIVDEAHQMPLHKGSWFAKLFDRLPRKLKTPRIGLSATTFRTADGAIFGPKGWFDCQPFEISVAELQRLGYLAPVRYVSPHALMTTKGVAKTAGDYNQGQLVRANLGRVEDQVRIIMDAMAGRQRGLIFAINVAHAQAYVEALREFDESPSLIIGDLSPRDRRAAVANFKSGASRIGVTVQAALTGFDVRELDLIASCRPTMSPIIHVQSIGRGTRTATGKADCVVLDFARNVPVFGPVHDPHFDKSGQPLGGVAPWRPCPSCSTYCAYEAEACSHCGAPLVVRQRVTSHELEYGKISWSAENRALLALTERVGMRNLPVESLALHAYRKTSDPTSESLMVSYGLGGEAIVRLWFKRLRSSHWAQAWASMLGDSPAPRSIPEAYARRGELIRPASINVYREGNFWRVSDLAYGGEDDEAEAA